ncbi:hypothetical protein GBA52_008940 [Prunus armeniaca]|nr:hypothetical protein GBA52_008940 [Prunus armeniaca]
MKALIPKIASQTQVTEFRPIDLCNALYKIISKTVANRLKKALPHVISKFQSALIPDSSYSVLLQGRPFGKLILSKGLSQRDPISPYLFLIVAEGFSAVLHQAEFNYKIRGVSIVASTPSLNHLFFVDDSLLFCDAEPTQVDKLKRIFRIYEDAFESTD